VPDKPDNRGLTMTWKRTGALDSQLDGIYFGVTNGAGSNAVSFLATRWSGDTLKYAPGSSRGHNEQRFHAFAADIEKIAAKNLR
jgi:hypothetical protein